MKSKLNASVISLGTVVLLMASVAPDITAAPLALNTTVTGILSEPGQQASYTFTGTSGQRLFYDALDGDFDGIAVRLLGPSGAVIHLNQNADSDSAQFTLIESGGYTLVIDGNGATTGDFGFRLDDLGTQPPLVLDSVIGKTLNPGFSIDWYKFTAVGGEHLYFDGLGPNLGGNWNLYGPNGVSIGSAGIGADFEVTLTQPGVHLLAIIGTSPNPVPYSIQVLTPTDPIKTLTFNTAASGVLAGPGDQALYTFTATAGQRLFYDALEGDFDSIGVRLLHPSGTSVFLNQNADSDGGPYTIVDSGIYTLVIDGNGPTTGDFSFRLLNLATLPALPFDAPITKTLTPGFSADFYAFEGIAGQTLYFDGLGANAGGTWNLFGPGNENIGGSSIGGDFEITLPRSGAHFLAIAGSAASPVAYSVQVVTFDLPTNPLVLGSTVNGTLAEPGERDLFTFAGTAGQRLYYDALDRDFESINARLLSPTGTILWEVNHASDRDPITLTQTGSYSLVLDGNAGTVGDYSFRLLDLASAAAMNLTTPISGSLNPRSRTDAYQFNGTKGQRISFDSLSATASDANWRLISPANVILATGNIVTDLPRVVLPQTGAMVLLIEGTAENVTPLNYQVQLADASEAPVATTGLGTIVAGNVAAGTPVTNKFTASAGLLVYFDSQDRSSSGVAVEIRDPANVLAQSIGASADFGPFLLASSGSYSIVIRGAGSYRFRLLDLAAASPALALGAEAQANLDPGYRTDVYQFNGVAGKRLLYDALDNDNDSVTIRLLAPDGNLRINGNSDTDTAPFALPVTGTYFLFIESFLPGVTDYRFRLHDVDAAPALPIEVPVVGTLTPGLSATLYRLGGTPGRLLYFDYLAATGGGAWVLYGPNNEALQFVNWPQDLEQVLAAGGEYVLALLGTSTSPIPYSFEVFDPAATAGGPVITSISLAGVTSTVEWTTVAAQKYVLQFKAALEDATWTDLPGIITAAGATASKTDAVGAAARRFYRVKQVP